VIILRDKKTQAIKGFSTQKLFFREIDGRPMVGVFSGDTVVDREYWGDRSLSNGFYWYLTKLSLRYPWRGIYWHLISKGYKTYLLMTNNFLTHYPRYDRPTPAFEWKIIDQFARELFPDAWRPELGLLVFPEGRHEKLKEGITPITEELKARIPQVNFFAQKNPHWQRGDELVCLAEYRLYLPLLYVLRLFKRKRKKSPVSVPSSH
jgi:hypothetical protein